MKNFFRIIFRWLTGDLFFVLFLLFSLLTIVRFRLLKADFWIGALQNTDVYDQISLQSQKSAGANPLAVQMVRGLTPDFFQNIVETNLTRLEGFVVGKDPELLREGNRIERVAKGSGTSTSDVKELINQYKQSKKLIKMMGGSPEKLAKKFKGKIPGFKI